MAENMSTIEFIESDKKPSGAVDSRATSDAAPAKAPVTPLLVMGVSLAVLQSLNFGLGIGLVNLSAPAVQEVLGLGAWVLNGTVVAPGTAGASFYVPEKGAFAWSWVVSIFAVGGILGGMLGGPITARLGPKRTQLANNVLFIVSALLQGLASNVGMMMAGRVFAGMAAGILCSAVPMWVSECSPDHVRGAFGVFHQLAVTIGILFASLLGMASVCGNTDSWWILYGFGVVPAALHLVGFWFMPDSPRYLVASGDMDGAEAALRRLRGNKYDVRSELEGYQAEVQRQADEGAMGMAAALRALFARQYIKQTVIAIGLQVAQQMSGINAIMFYSGQIFLDAGFSNGELATILVNVVNVLATVAAVPLIERAGRRGLSLGGFGGMALFHALFGLAMVFGWQAPSIAFMLLGVVSFAVGPGPIPWMITAEIFPASVRGGAVGAAVFTNWVFTFAVGMFFPPLQAALGAYTFFFFCGCTVLITAYVFFCVPETRGKSMAQIQAMF